MQNLEAVQTNLKSLVDEYRGLGHAIESPNETDRLVATLVNNADWSGLAARTLVSLVRDYGSFMLRNAAALAIALDLEDGELGF